VHPRPSKINNIPSFVALVQQKPPPSDGLSTPPAVATTLLLAWLPESALGDAYDTYVKVGLIDAETPPRQSFPVLFFHDSECASTIVQSKKRLGLVSIHFAKKVGCPGVGRGA